MKKLLLPLLLLLAFGMLLADQSAPSAVVGYVKYPVVAGNNMAAIPMTSQWEWASEIGISLGEGVDMVSYWDATSQSFFTATNLIDFWDGDFEVASGSVLMIYSSIATNMYSIGSLPAANATYSLVAGNNTVMIPLNRSDLAYASELGTELAAGPVDMVSYWDATSQSFFTATNLIDFWDGDFDVTIGMPLMVYAGGSITWPTRSLPTIKTKN